MYNINNCDISISQNSFNVRLRNRLNIGVYIRQVFTFVDGRQVFTFVVGKIRTNAQMLNVGNISKSENKWFNNNVIK